MEQIEKNGRLDEWCQDNLDWLRKTYGTGNVVSAVLHMDEETPHIHATIVPIVQTERKKQKGGVRDVDNIVEGTRSRLPRRDIGRKHQHPVYVPMRS